MKEKTDARLFLEMIGEDILKFVEGEWVPICWDREIEDPRKRKIADGIMKKSGVARAVYGAMMYGDGMTFKDEEGFFN